MIRLRGAERESEGEEKRGDGWTGREGGGGGGVKVGPAALCTADRLLMVFVSPRPVPVCRGQILLGVT